MLTLGTTNNSNPGFKPDASSLTNKTAGNVSDLADDTVDMQLDDAESAQQAVPAPAPTAATGGTNNDDVNDVQLEQPGPPAAEVEQCPMKVDDEAVGDP